MWQNQGLQRLVMNSHYLLPFGESFIIVMENTSLNIRIFSHVRQLNFALFCVTSALGISWQHLNHPDLLLRSAYRFHVYFHILLILHELGISLPHQNGFSKVKNSYINSAYYSLCDDCGVDLSETWMYRD